MFFITFAKNDLAVAAKVAEKLTEIGLPVWYDADVESATAAWSDDVEQKLLTAHAVLLIVTPDGMSSRSALFEWAVAYGAKVPVVPLMFQKTGVHPVIRAMRGFDFTKQPDWNGLASYLQSTFHVQAAPASDGAAPKLRISDDLDAALQPYLQTGNSSALSDWVSLDPLRMGELLALAAEEPALNAFLKKEGLSDNLLAFNQQLNDPSPEKRAEAVIALSRLDENAVAYPLMRALQDESLDVSKQAVRALGANRRPLALRALIDVLIGDRQELVAATITTLSRYGDRAVQPIGDALGRLGPDDQDRKTGLVRALASLKSPESVRPLIFQLEDNHDAYSVTLARTLKEYGDPAVDEMLKVLKTTNDSSRVRAIVRALGRIGNPRAIDPLIKLLEGTDSSTGQVINASLIGFGRQALPNLQAALKHDEWLVRRSAAAVMRELGYDPTQYGYRE